MKIPTITETVCSLVATILSGLGELIGFVG